jgi:predicted DNA-binding WGR domain protein
LIRYIRWTAPKVARKLSFVEKRDEKLQMLVLERRDKSRNLARFYVLAIEPTLFGDAALVREWGRIGSLGRRRLDLHADPVAARESLALWLTRKSRRGYRVAATSA